MRAGLLSYMYHSLISPLSTSQMDKVWYDTHMAKLDRGPNLGKKRDARL